VAKCINKWFAFLVIVVGMDECLCGRLKAGKSDQYVEQKKFHVAKIFRRQHCARVPFELRSQVSNKLRLFLTCALGKLATEI